MDIVLKSCQLSFVLWFDPCRTDFVSAVLFAVTRVQRLMGVRVALLV
jgi:hypothetical protein